MGPVLAGVIFSMEAPQLDPALDPQAYSYTWEATNEAGEVLPTVPTTDPLSDLLTGVTIPTAAWTPALETKPSEHGFDPDGRPLLKHNNLRQRHPNLPLPRVTSGDADLGICAGDD